jgi:hypothetical protein
MGVVIRMTIEDKAKLESLYENKRSLTRGHKSEVQFVYESRDVSEIESILQQINNGSISIGSHIARIENASTVKDKTKTLSGCSISEDSGFPQNDCRPREALLG